ncbi:MAG: ABC transporter substrate-binding protein, partial [Nitrospinota bacterium]
QAGRVAAIRGGRAMIEFRGFPPKSRDDLVRALGDKIRVQESDWNCALFVAMDHRKKPFNDPRVRRALTLALDRWKGSKDLSRIAIVKTPGGVVFPKHPLAATREELHKIAGYWPDIKKSRAEARRLLREAGVPEGFTFEFHNRAVDQPYKHIGIWAIDQWRKIGLNVTQRVNETTAFYKDLRGGNFQTSMDFNCQSIVNPTLDISKFISDDKSGNNHGKYIDREVDKLFDLQARQPNPKKQREIIRKYEKRILDEQAHYLVTFWWYRIIPHNARVRGWKISPSHYINQDLVNVWLAPK